jgi:hypothetical protein
MTAEAEARMAAVMAEQRAADHNFLADRARRLMNNLTDQERAELARLIEAGPGNGLRAAVYNLEISGIRPVLDPLCA